MLFGLKYHCERGLWHEICGSTAVEEVLIIQKKLQNFLVPEFSLGLKLSYETYIILV